MGSNLKYKAGFIGVGNMGSALCRAVAKTGCSIGVTDHSTQKADDLSKELSCTATDTRGIVKDSQYIFLGVKPQMLPELLGELKELLGKREERYIIVSMAAGVKTEKIKRYLGEDCPIIRIMPNLPASVGKGVILTSPNEKVTPEETEEFKALMAESGLVDIIPEELIDAGCALSGSGPAYVCLFIESLAKGAEKCGLPRDKAMAYAVATLLGTAEQISLTRADPEALRISVCSPGGTTLAGLAAMNEKCFDEAVVSGIEAAYKRSIELSK